MSCGCLLSGVCLILSTLSLSVSAKKSFPERSFPEVVVVNNRTVSCSGKSSGKHYNSPIYTCENITVDGKLLLHGYMDPYPNQANSAFLCSNCPCGQILDEPNDMHLLCKNLLASSKLGKGETLSFVHIPHPVCKQKGPEERVKYIKPYNSEQPKLDIEPYWADTLTANGYVYTLKCVTSRISA